MVMAFFRLIPKQLQQSNLDLGESFCNLTILNGSILETWSHLRSSNPRAAKLKFRFLQLLAVILLLLLFSFPLFARNPGTTPLELSSEQKQFAYEPWYTGPIIGGSGECLDPGFCNIQPYILAGHLTKYFDLNGNTASLQTKRTTVDTTAVAQFGLVSGLDLTLILEEFYAHIDGRSVYTFGDTTVCLGMQIHHEDTRFPAMRLLFEERFPSGRYQYLNPVYQGMDAFICTGCFTSSIRLNLSKMFYWFYRHPIECRLNLMQSFCSSVRVHEFHAYGGGYGTNGTVYPPKSFSASLSFEFSFTQRWACAMDIMYQRYTRTRFSGIPGVDEDGDVAGNSMSYFQLYVLTPSLEYNISKNQGLLAGAYITIAGHNAYKIINGVLSYEILF
jgi:hypothetical protein